MRYFWDGHPGLCSSSIFFSVADDMSFACVNDSVAAGHASVSMISLDSFSSFDDMALAKSRISLWSELFTRVGSTPLIYLIGSLVDGSDRNTAPALASILSEMDAFATESSTPGSTMPNDDPAAR